VEAFAGAVDSGRATGLPATCYYYRKAYYRAFFLTAGLRGKRREEELQGETKFPFILQNLHRYFLYFAVLFLFFLWKDVFLAFNFDGKFGMGVGTLVLLVNIILLTTYTLFAILAAPCGRKARLFFVRDVWKAKVQGVAVADDIK